MEIHPRLVNTERDGNGNITRLLLKNLRLRQIVDFVDDF